MGESVLLFNSLIVMGHGASSVCQSVKCSGKNSPGQGGDRHLALRPQSPCDPEPQCRISFIRSIIVYRAAGWMIKVGPRPFGLFPTTQPLGRRGRATSVTILSPVPQVSCHKMEFRS